MLPFWAHDISSCVNPARSLGEVGNAAVSDPLRHLCRGNRHAHFSRPRHQFWNDGLEPAAIFASGLGLGFHSRSDGDRDRPRAATCRVVLPRTAGNSGAARSAFGPRSPSGPSERTYSRARSGYGFPIAVVGIVSAIFAAVIFVPAAQGAGFRWTRASWCRAGLALIVRLHCLAAATASQSPRGCGTIRSCAALASGEPGGASPAADADALGGTSQHSGRRVAHHFSRTGRRSREARNFIPTRSPVDYIEQARKLRDVQIYLWFARFPVWRVVHREGNETAVEISDVRFFREDGPVAPADPQAAKKRRRIASRRAGFTFQIVFDAQGRILPTVLGNRSSRSRLSFLV